MLKFHALKLVGRHPEGDDAVCLHFEVPEELISMYVGQAGQHIVLKARIDGEEVRRTYSLVSAAGGFPLRIGVRLHDRGRMSQYLTSALELNEQVDVLPPNGSFVSKFNDNQPRRYAGFAAGCGITPVLALIRSKLAAEPGSQWVLFYGNRSASRVMFLEEILGLKDQYLDRLAVHFVMSQEPQDIGAFNGHIDGDKLRTLGAPFLAPGATDEFFICGPNDMISAVSGALVGLGISPQQVHVEHFTLETVSAGERSEKTSAVMEGSAQITVIMDGRRRTFDMALGGDTVLEAALSAGVELPYSCCAGVCATCRTKAVSGSVDMAENFALDDWELEQGYILACQSRPRGAALVLDYDEV
jgi:ring-1,2-phenylacetyl-CoA epoxidase subunit PaaE